MENQSEVDVNVLIKLYHNKLSQLINQNLLLEAKLTTLSQDYKDKFEELLIKNTELSLKIEESEE
jgi:uncharacterized protein YeeX (DUF496 family)